MKSASPRAVRSFFARRDRAVFGSASVHVAAAMVRLEGAMTRQAAIKGLERQ
jgi:hypothetical protein